MANKYEGGMLLDYLSNSGTNELETERLFLRKFKESDALDIYVNWASDKDSAKYNAWSVHPHLEVTKEYLSEWIESYKNNDYYHWAIVHKEKEEVIGSISVSNINRRKKYCEVGYTIAKKMWNLGIATEVLIRVIKYLTEEAGFETIRALHDVRNEASGRVMKKAGMTYVKNKTLFLLSRNHLIMRCCVYEYKRQTQALGKQKWQ